MFDLAYPLSTGECAFAMAVSAAGGPEGRRTSAAPAPQERTRKCRTRWSLSGTASKPEKALFSSTCSGVGRGVQMAVSTYVALVTHQVALLGARSTMHSMSALMAAPRSLGVYHSLCRRKGRLEAVGGGKMLS
jgi:hypothetical protein